MTSVIRRTAPSLRPRAKPVSSPSPRHLNSCQSTSLPEQKCCGYSHWIVCNAPLCCVKRSPPEILGAAHVDSGFVTLLAQDGVAGLQAEDSCGRWTDVPAEEGSLAVNFGGLLERWTGGRVRATRHRVIGYGTPRYSIPFFYEPAADALIETLPLPDTPCIAPFRYGDHLWSAMMRFPEFRGLEGARIPRGV